MPASIAGVPLTAKDCKTCPQCVLFVLANDIPQRATSSKRKIAPAQSRGLGKAALLRRLSSAFASMGDESTWSDVLTGMCAGGFIENINEGMQNVQPIYRICATAAIVPPAVVERPKADRKRRQARSKKSTSMMNGKKQRIQRVVKATKKAKKQISKRT